MSVDRQSLGLSPRVTFVAPGTTFERLLKETSLGELNATITKKLKLKSKLVLTQVRGDVRIVLEDEDDFEAFRAAAHSSGLAEIAISSVNSSKVPQTTVQAEQEGRPIVKEKLKTARKKKPKNANTPPADEVVNANSDAHASPASVSPLQTQKDSDEASKQIEVVRPIQSTSAVMLDNTLEPVQNSVHDTQGEKKAKRKRRQSIAPGVTVSEVPAVVVDTKIDSTPKKKRKAAVVNAESLIAPSTTVAGENTTGPEVTAASKRQPEAPLTAGSSNTRHLANVDAEPAEPPKAMPKKPRKNKNKDAITVPTAVVADPASLNEAQVSEVTKAALLSVNASDAAPDTPRQSTAEAVVVTTQPASAESVTGKKRKNPKGLEQSDSVAVAPRKRRKGETAASLMSAQEHTGTAQDKSTEPNLPQTKDAEGDQSKLSLQTRSLAEQINRGKSKKKVQLPTMNAEEKAHALEDVFASVMRRNKAESTINQPAQIDGQLIQENADAPVDGASAQIALKESINQPKKTKPKKGKYASEVPQTEASQPSTTALQHDTTANEKYEDQGSIPTVQLNGSNNETGRPTAATSKVGARRASTKKAALLAPSESDPAAQKLQGNRSEAEAGEGSGANGPARGSGDQSAGLDKVIHSVVAPSSFSALPIPPSGSSIAEVEVQGNEESSSSDSDSDSNTDDDNENGSDDDLLTGKQPELVLNAQSNSDKSQEESHDTWTSSRQLSRPSSPRVRPADTAKVSELADEPLSKVPVDEMAQSHRDFDDDTTAVQSHQTSSEEEAVHDEDDNNADFLNPTDDHLLEKHDANAELAEWNDVSSEPQIYTTGDIPPPGMNALNAATESIMTDLEANAALSEAMDEDHTSFLLKVGNENGNEVIHRTQGNDVSQQRSSTPPRRTQSKPPGTPLSVQRMKTKNGKTQVWSTGVSRPVKLKSAEAPSSFEPPKRVTRRTASAARDAMLTADNVVTPKLFQAMEATLPETEESKESEVESESHQRRMGIKAITPNVPFRNAPTNAIRLTTSNDQESSDAASSEGSDESSAKEGASTNEIGDQSDRKEEKVVTEEISHNVSRAATRQTTTKNLNWSQQKIPAHSQPMLRIGMPRLSHLSSQNLFSPQAKSQPLPSSKFASTQASQVQKSNGHVSDSGSSSSSSSDSDEQEASHIPKEKRAGSKTPKARKSLAHYLLR